MAAIVAFRDFIPRRAEKIRKYLIDNNYIDAIIQLPSNLFFGTSIATCIMVLKKSKANNITLFIDASKEAVKVTNNNKLTPKNIENILAIYTNQKEITYVSKLVPNSKIEEEGYNLSVSTYVEIEDTREKIDIKLLNKEIEEIVTRQDELRKAIDEIVAEIEVE